VCVKYIKDNFQFNQLVRKKELYELNRSEISAKHKGVENLDEMELFRTFKKYDRNMNGVLEFSEYAQCLSEQSNLQLTKQEIITSTLSADLNQDGRIDFEEFMKHFSDFINMMHFNNQLSSLYAKEQEQLRQIELQNQQLKQMNDYAKDPKNQDAPGIGSSF
jgi:hypothetical protein